MVVALFAMFFLSGAAALVHEVGWVRSLGLVFGGSHLAVTIVLAVYMGGQALGAWLMGKRADVERNPLRLYGIVEVGIGLFALVFLLAMQVYPSLYVPLARLGARNPAYLTVLRVVFAVAAMAVPTTLMGATLPIVSRFLASRRSGFGRHLSFLYGFNTAGAIAGTAAAGFFLLKTFGVTATLVGAAAVNLAVGAVAVALSRRIGADATQPAPGEAPEVGAPVEGARVSPFASRLVLWGIGVSGFCALGYEVLWTRMLSMVVGTSTYSFTIMLVAFLAGITLGSYAFGAIARSRRLAAGGASVLLFGVVQVVIGGSAFAVTLLMRDLPSHATALQSALVGSSAGEFGARLGASFAVAFVYMATPAFFMGVAFPLAGAVLGTGSARVGGEVGRVVAFNTTGAILGSSVSGLVLVFVFGIERSLQLLVVLNVAVGLAVASTTLARWTTWSVAAGAAALALALAVFPGWARFWDLKYFAVFRNNQRDAFATPERVREALENTDVLYYHQGVNETISVIQPKGFMQAFVVNGRPEASTVSMDMQCQRTLGHVPMLLHPNPRSVFVLGTGTGMTLGATSIHPEVDRLVLAEIEHGVIGAARTFGAYNHHVLDNPKLDVVFDDGRNFLRTTEEKFDVITADPIHPWSGGAAYLYTTEYFRSVASRLRPGGIACQWLPIYELTPRDLATVVRTFAANFEHVMVWLTHYDAELVGSNDPIVIDPAELARRMAHPAIREDLAAVKMGSPEDLLSYFVFGTEGARTFAEAGVLNTDDNLVLEFSAPESVGVPGLPGANVAALARHRQSIVPYLAAGAPAERAALERRWTENVPVARAYDKTHELFLLGEAGRPEFGAFMAWLGEAAPSYAPFRFLQEEHAFAQEMEPRLVADARFPVIGTATDRVLHLSAVTVRTGYTRAAVMFVDNERRELYAERYVDAPQDEVLAVARELATSTLDGLRIEYERLAASSAGRRPREVELAGYLKTAIGVTSSSPAGTAR